MTNKLNLNHLNLFQKRLSEQDLSTRTIKGYLNDIQYFQHWLAEFFQKSVELIKTNKDDIKAYRQELINLKRQKAASVNRRIQSLKRFYQWALQNKLISIDPTEHIRFVRRQHAIKPEALNKKEIHALLRAADQSKHGLAKRNYALVQLMLQAGLRIGEVAKLQQQDITINERSGVVRVVNGKGTREREVPLNATARRAISEYLFTINKAEAAASAFFNKRGQPTSLRALQMAISTLVTRSNIERIKVSAHTLRHTFAINFLKANPGKLTELATLMGHDSLNTTAIYTKASNQFLAEAVELSEVNIYD